MPTTPPQKILPILYECVTQSHTPVTTSPLPKISFPLWRGTGGVLACLQRRSGPRCSQDNGRINYTQSVVECRCAVSPLLSVPTHINSAFASSSSLISANYGNQNEPNIFIKQERGTNFFRSSFVGAHFN